MNSAAVGLGVEGKGDEEEEKEEDDEEDCCVAAVANEDGDEGEAEAKNRSGSRDGGNRTLSCERVRGAVE